MSKELKCTWCGGPRPGKYLHCSICQSLGYKIQKAKLREDEKEVKRLIKEREARKDPTLYHGEMKPINTGYIMTPKGSKYKGRKKGCQKRTS